MTFKHIDIHSHLNFSHFDADREIVIERMKEEGIATITVGTDKKTSQESVALAEKHSHIFATIGVHPTHIEESGGVWETFDETFYKGLLGPRVVAIGECGLDYFRLSSDANGSRPIKDKQKELFVRQIEFAVKHNLLLMIHGRPSKGTMDAYDDIFEIIRTYPNVRGNMHFFVGDMGTAKKFLDIGFTLSFDGPITFTKDYDDVIRFAPLDMIMAETDAPFAAPVPHRGKRNEPLFVPHIAKRIVEIRGEDPELVRRALVENAIRVFNLPIT